MMFRGGKGQNQGNPLSPKLYVLAIKILTQLLQKRLNQVPKEYDAPNSHSRVIYSIGYLTQ